MILNNFEKLEKNLKKNKISKFQFKNISNNKKMLNNIVNLFDHSKIFQLFKLNAKTFTKIIAQPIRAQKRYVSALRIDLRVFFSQAKNSNKKES